VQPDQHCIFIVGAGIHVPAQLTLEAVDALQTCEEVWSNIPEVAQGKMPAELQARMKTLWPYYQANRPRAANYAAIAEHLLARAVSMHRIGYLTQGHPLVFDSVTNLILRESGALEVAPVIIPGLSSIDTILVDVRYDPAHGLQVHEASAFARTGTRIDTRAALLLLQLSVFGTRMPRLKRDCPGPDLRPLQAALTAIYPETHCALFVRSGGPAMRRRVVETEIGRIADVSPDEVLGGSLFIPPLRSD
jgi:hypothetical protein